jgi:hypothetical protein
MLIREEYLSWRVAVRQASHMRRNLPALLQRDNSVAGSAAELHIFICDRSGLAVEFMSPRRSHFRKADFKNRANRTQRVCLVFAKAFSDDHRDIGCSIHHSLCQHDFAADRTPARRIPLCLKAGSSLVKAKAGFAKRRRNGFSILRLPRAQSSARSIPH